MELGNTWSSQLGSRSIDQQVTALREIARSGETRGFTILVVKLAGSPDDEVRVWAAEALESSIRPVIEEAGGLIEQLQRADDGEVCYWSATMLGRLGEELAATPEIASNAVLALEACARDSSYLPARERAAWALRQLGAASKAALPTLRKLAAEAPPRLQRLSGDAVKAIVAAA